MFKIVNSNKNMKIASVLLMNNKRVFLPVRNSTTAKDLQENIFESFFRQFLPEQTILIFKEKILEWNQNIAELCSPEVRQINLIHKMAELWELQSHFTF